MSAPAPNIEPVKAEEKIFPYIPTPGRRREDGQASPTPQHTASVAEGYLVLSGAFHPGDTRLASRLPLAIRLGTRNTATLVIYSVQSRKRKISTAIGK